MSDAGDKNNKQPDKNEPVPTASFADMGVSGDRVGPYKLLSVLGEGGFAVVYLAEQQGQVKRRVALKVIKPGMDTKQVIARFEAERQALALLKHPNIAQVYDAGMTPASRPYFVMEHVKGLSLTRFAKPSSTLTRKLSSTATSSRRTSLWPLRVTIRCQRLSTSVWPRPSASP